MQGKIHTNWASPKRRPRLTRHGLPTVLCWILTNVHLIRTFLRYSRIVTINCMSLTQLQDGNTSSSMVSSLSHGGNPGPKPIKSLFKLPSSAEAETVDGSLHLHPFMSLSWSSHRFLPAHRIQQPQIWLSSSVLRIILLHSCVPPLSATTWLADMLLGLSLIPEHRKQCEWRVVSASTRLSTCLCAYWKRSCKTYLISMHISGRTCTSS